MLPSLFASRRVSLTPQNISRFEILLFRDQLSFDLPKVNAPPKPPVFSSDKKGVDLRPFLNTLSKSQYPFYEDVDSRSVTVFTGGWCLPHKPLWGPHVAELHFTLQAHEVTEQQSYCDNALDDQQLRLWLAQHYQECDELMAMLNFKDAGNGFALWQEREPDTAKRVEPLIKCITVSGRSIYTHENNNSIDLWLPFGKRDIMSFSFNLQLVAPEKPEAWSDIMNKALQIVDCVQDSICLIKADDLSLEEH